MLGARWNAQSTPMPRRCFFFGSDCKCVALGFAYAHDMIRYRYLGHESMCSTAPPVVPAAARRRFMFRLPCCSLSLSPFRAGSPPSETNNGTYINHTGFHRYDSAVHPRGGDFVVPTAGDPVGVRLLRNLRRHLVRGVHPRRTEVCNSINPFMIIDLTALSTCFLHGYEVVYFLGKRLEIILGSMVLFLGKGRSYAARG